ncbi:solute carrier organic anion transporter family member 1C1 [Boleophthalmus pectinirostris]|uniref:solute carrier organic anion transporter family member 1C1 n=1 Tax=Boleophthalmus pectinirostris TaxID=150288 RepID=UPI00242E02F7|nr:solute carrier organic anion transporter family member 1C1 [Boleophthalmus pectinirostris]
MEETEDRGRMTSQQALCAPPGTPKKTCLSTLKLFLMALSFSFFSKAMTGSYMKSSITQIERRFDLSTSHVGLIDGSFEMGNLLLLAVVSHFGAKLHRPRLIAAGCTLMAIGSLLTGLTHFFMGRYEYSSVVQNFQNHSVSVAACVDPLMEPELQTQTPGEEDKEACVRDSSSSMWVYMFLGNALRGIGESPVMPLGISYIDDFAEAENSPFYIACLQTITILGPMFGFLLGSLCAKLYVDIGFVDMDSVLITPKDSRWVGAWWLGFLVCSGLLLISSIPFWFLPRSLSKQEDKTTPTSVSECGAEAVLDQKQDLKLKDIAKAFLPSLKRLLGTPTYFLLICGSVLRFNSLIGFITFTAKYIEQQFGQSASRANFLIGVLNLPAVALGIFLGGLLMKRYKLSIVSGAQLSFASSFMAYLLILLQFGTKCDNIPVAGLTVSYNGTHGIQQGGSLLSDCNSDCMCSTEEWDPVCSDNGITYVSPCLAGCISSSGYGKNTVFNNCSCVDMSYPAGSSSSVKLGQCPHAKDCTRSFKSYMAVSVLSSFIMSLGFTPGYMVIIRCIVPELKSLALGVEILVSRTLGGIPAPVYFGALIDSTCLKWAVKKCGGRGACRIYDSDMYRIIFLGLITVLSGSSYIFIIAVIVLLRRQYKKPTAEGVEVKGVELRKPSSAQACIILSKTAKLQQERASKPTTEVSKEVQVQCPPGGSSPVTEDSGSSTNNKTELEATISPNQETGVSEK